MSPPPVLPEASFQTRLRVERIEDASRDGRGTWLLLAVLIYVSRLANRSFEVPAGFITDLASVPRLPFVYLLTGGMGHAAAVLHDWLYTTHEVPRDVADAIFREALVHCGVSEWQACLMWLGVRVGGGSSWNAPGQDQAVVVQQEINESQREAA